MVMQQKSSFTAVVGVEFLHWMVGVFFSLNINCDNVTGWTQSALFNVAQEELEFFSWIGACLAQWIITFCHMDTVSYFSHCQ